jgi:hypothetical protein
MRLEIKTLEDKLKVISSFTRHDVRNKLVAVNGVKYIFKSPKIFVLNTNQISFRIFILLIFFNFSMCCCYVVVFVLKAFGQI